MLIHGFVTAEKKDYRGISFWILLLAALSLTMETQCLTAEKLEKPEKVEKHSELIKGKSNTFYYKSIRK